MDRKKFLITASLAACSVSIFGQTKRLNNVFLGDCETTNDILGPFYNNQTFFDFSDSSQNIDTLFRYGLSMVQLGLERSCLLFAFSLQTSSNKKLFHIVLTYYLVQNLLQ